MDPRNPQDYQPSSPAPDATPSTPPPPSQPSYNAPTQPTYSQPPPPQQQPPQYGGQQYSQQGQPPPGYQQPPQHQYPPQYQQPQPQYQQYQQYPPPPKKGGSGLIWGLLGLLVVALIGGGVLLFFVLQPGNRTVSTTTSTNPTATANTTSQNTPAPGETPNTRPTRDAGPSTNTGDNAGLLKAAARNMRNLDSYTFDANISAAGQDVLMRADLENLKGSDKSAKMEIEAQGQNVQVIVLGPNVWASVDGGATFTDASANGAQMTSSIDQFANMWDNLTDAEVDKAKDQLKDGSPATETIDGVNTKHMIGDIQSMSSLGGATGGGATEGTVELWVSTDSPGYVHKMRIDATSGGQPVQGTITWSNFNENFNIQAP